jgi:hypothetical protein
MEQRYRALAVDFDGILTTAGRPRDEVLGALARCRREGIVTILVTGRLLSELHDVFEDAESHFDAIVAENGGTFRQLAPGVSRALAGSARHHGIDVRAGAVLLAPASTSTGCWRRSVGSASTRSSCATGTS